MTRASGPIRAVLGVRLALPLRRHRLLVDHCYHNRSHILLDSNLLARA